MKKFLIILTIILIPFIINAEQDELFRTRGNAGLGSSFIHTAANAYGVSTGGILTIFGSTVDSVFWNPAGLCEMEKDQFQLSGGAFSYDRKIASVSFAKLTGVDQDKAWGITVFNSYTGKIDVYNEFDEYQKKLEYFGNALILSYAVPATMVKIGFNFKVLNEIIENDHAYGGALDLGLLITPPLPVFMGVSVFNLPGYIKWGAEDDLYEIGSGYKFGLGYKTVNDSMKIGLNFSKSYGDEKTSVNLGSEIAVSEAIALRFGVLEGNISVGLGISMGFLHIDYAYINEFFLDSNHSSHLAATTFSF